jgi:hypothetical protein
VKEPNLQQRATIENLTKNPRICQNVSGDDLKNKREITSLISNIYNMDET